MLLDLKIVKNYSHALFANAQIISKESKVLEQVTFFANLMQESLIVHNAFCSPIVEKEIKIKLVGLVADKYKFESVSRQFLYVLIKNARFLILPQIVDAFEKLIATDKGIKSVELLSAFKLSTKDIEVIREFIEAELGQQVALVMNTDPSLIGGVVIKYDSNLIDCSVQGALNKIEKLVTNSK
jgi:F-type H+-transporting ATPase subunit delta